MSEEKRTITILSHKNPDVDSMISGVLMQKLLRSRGHDANYVIPDKTISEESAAICLKYGIDPAEYQGEVPEDANLFLVDHHETEVPGKVIGIIDHHPTNKEIQCGFYRNRASCSTAMLIYKFGPSVFEPEDIKRVAIANLIDTNAFSSTKTVQADAEWTKRACEENGFDYQEIYNDGLCLTDITDPEKAATHGEKSYCYQGKNLKSSYIQVTDVDPDTLGQLIDQLRQRVTQQGLHEWVFLVQDMARFKTAKYEVTPGDCEVKPYQYPKMVSRADIMAGIEKRIMEEQEQL